ncbi:MAG: glycosyltransferase, partial [Verrucomicrobia bacterium]|nr:glycosyltransferase [Verrucomicrobiota bacterium]
PLHYAPYDFFRYTPFALEKLLAEAGFTGVKIQAMSGWNASLAQVMGLWLKRSPLTPEARNQWAKQLWPLYQQLVNSDELPADPKAGNTMATGWSGLALVPAAATAAAQPAAPEVEPSDLPVVIVRAAEHNYSETFLEDHVKFVSRQTTLLYGHPFPRFLAGGQSVLPEALEQKLSAAVAAGGALPAGLWQEYSAALAGFLSQCGARVALVETGLMGAFVHEACEQAALPYVVHFHGVDAFGRELLERWLSVEVAQPADPATAGTRFGAVGQFVEKKAPHVTLTAFGAVVERVPTARLTMIGDGPMLAACREWVAKKGIAAAVTFAGVQSRAEVSRHMSESGIFVQHSVTAANGDSEGLPLAVLEAGAHGLPVISTKHAGIPDAVRDGVDGLLGTEKDVKAMAVAMLRLANDPALAAKLGGAFRARVSENYSRRRSIERLQGLLLAAAEGRPAEGVGEAVAETAVASPEVATGPERAIAEDRNNRSAYFALAELLMKEGRLADAYCALGELHRVTGGGKDTLELLQSLEAEGVLEHPAVATYRHRAGWSARPTTELPRRILIVTNLLPPQEMGGYGRTMWEFGRELAARGHTVLVLTADLPQLVRKPTPEHAAFETHVRRTLRLCGDWKDGAAVAEPDLNKRREIVRANHQLVLATAKEFRPDVVIAGNLDFVGHFFVQELLNQGLPVLHRLGNATPGFEPAQAPKSPLYCLAGCSEWVNGNLRAKGYPFSRYAVLPPGSPLAEYFRAFAPQREVLRIAFASLLMPYKGAHVLMDALGHLQQAGIPFECTFAGDTTSPEYLENLRAFATKQGFADRLRFPGFLAKKELAALYARSNVLVFPSVFEEPFGKTQIEAMAAGLVVISSGNGGALDIIRDGETGLFFRNKDSLDLAAKLTFVHDQPARAAAIALAGQADAFRFTTAASVDRLEEILQELVLAAATKDGDAPVTAQRPPVLV